MTCWACGSMTHIYASCPRRKTSHAPPLPRGKSLVHLPTPLGNSSRSLATYLTTKSAVLAAPGAPTFTPAPTAGVSTQSGAAPHSSPSNIPTTIRPLLLARLLHDHPNTQFVCCIYSYHSSLSRLRLRLPGATPGYPIPQPAIRSRLPSGSIRLLAEGERGGLYGRPLSTAPLFPLPLLGPGRGPVTQKLVPPKTSPPGTSAAEKLVPPEHTRQKNQSAGDRPWHRTWSAPAVDGPPS